MGTYNWQDISDQLIRLLRLATPAVGMKWIRTKEELEVIPKVRIHDKSETYSVFKTYIEDEHAGTPEELLDELRGFCFMWAENYNFHEVKEFRSMNWAKGKRRTLVPERASQGGC